MKGLLNLKPVNKPMKHEDCAVDKEYCDLKYSEYGQHTSSASII